MPEMPREGDAAEREGDLLMPSQTHSPLFHKTQAAYFEADSQMYRAWNYRQRLLDATEDAIESDISPEFRAELANAEAEYQARVRVRAAARLEYVAAGAVI
jgi:hypothetical protein